MFAFNSGPTRAIHTLAAKLTNTNLAGADLTGALITDTKGSLSVQYYFLVSVGGALVRMHFVLTVEYPAGTFPDPQTAFTGATICPNSLTYEANLRERYNLATMMTVPDPPTTWQQTQSEAADNHTS